METLELKHLAPYLPYSISMQFIIREEVIRTGVMTRLLNYSHETHPERVAIDNYDSEHIWMFKPILMPLSDLTKDKWKEINTVFDFSELKDFDVNFIPYSLFIFLVKNHFDIFNLIPKGLAIDFNTLHTP